MFDKLAAVVLRRGWLFVVAWIALAVGLRAIAPAWETVSRDDDVRFFPPGYPSVVGQELLERGFPDDASGSVAVIAADRGDGKLGPADLAYIDSVSDVLGRLRSADLGVLAAEQLAKGGVAATTGRELGELTRTRTGLGIKQILDRRSPVIGPRLIGEARDGPGQATLTLVQLAGTYQSRRTRIAVTVIEDALAKLSRPPEGLRLTMTGSAAVGHDMNQASNASIANTTSATIALVVVILLVVYRSPLLALIPLVTIALSVKVSLWGIAALTRVPWLDFQVINITHIFVIVILFGAGTDYCLFLIARYREELARGRKGPDALREAISRVGGALVASAGTVICGLGMLWFSSFAKIQYTGPAIALSLAVGLLASLTLAPVLLHWLRGTVFWPFRPPHHEAGHDVEAEMLDQMPMSGFWTKVADVVVRRPGAILAASLMVLTPLAIVGIGTRANYSQLADLGPDEPSVIGAQVVQRYFSVGELSPTSVLVHHPKLNFRDDPGRDAIQRLTARIAASPGVAEVRSASQPLGRFERPSADLGFAQRLVREATRLVADRRFVSVSPSNPADKDHIARLEVVFKSDPFSDAALGSLGGVRAALDAAIADDGPLAGASAAGMAGATILIDDLKRVTTSDERRMYVLVTVGVYLILVLLLRRPGISLYLIATVVLGYLASLGLTELVFKAMHTGPEPWVGLDWKVGFFLFVILVAVGEDYNIFLMARVLEEEKKHGTVEGTRRAVAHTGGIISSCGLIMAGTFGSMLTGSLVTLKELGFALGLGALLDTFIVRPVLVPAFVVLLHRWTQRRRTLPESAPLAEVEASPPASSTTG